MAHLNTEVAFTANHKVVSHTPLTETKTLIKAGNGQSYLAYVPVEEVNQALVSSGIGIARFEFNSESEVVGVSDFWQARCRAK